MKCSLITPLRNERDNVERLWNQVQAQTLPPGEWIIADNGSDDGTFEWLQDKARTSPFPVRVLSLAGQTIAKMMNRAIHDAAFDVIACCHGGTQLTETWLECLLRPLRADPHVDVSAGVWFPCGETPTERWIAGMIRMDIDALDERTYLPATRSMAFRRAAWSKVGGFPEWLPRFGEDTLFAMKLRHAGCVFKIARDARVGWRPKPSIRSYMRQERLYTEGNLLMGYARASWRDFTRPWMVVPAAAGFYHGTGSVPATLLAVLLLPVADALNFRRKGLYAYASFTGFLFWKWLMPLSFQAGVLNGRRIARSQAIKTPPEDIQAVESYLSLIK